MTLLREVIHIPERVTQSDFVVGLADGVANRQQTLRQYVVTPQLVDCFDRALGLVGEGLRSGRSQAAFLHGSFGSGKSHFMAVLYQLLRHDPDARAIPELASTLAKHDRQIGGKQILPLTYHLIGAPSLEAAVFEGYVRQVRAAHPDCPLPAVHRSDALLENADRQRDLLGDERFFLELNGGTGGNRSGVSAGLSGLRRAVASTAGWDLTSYDTARAAPAGDPRRSRLVSDLVRTLLPAFASSTDYVDIDTGLAVMAQHAHDLGYDAVVLFLDELILWLASHLGNREFVSNEGAKLAKLVESQDSSRAIPLVSLISRQRDLVEFLGTHVPGAERAAFADVFGWSRGRFEDIPLADRNLPMIAQRRLLAPVDPDAKRVLDEAFAAIDRRPEVWDVLLAGTQMDGSSTGSDQEAFRRTYPFSPALVATLVALSQALQRERTALKVMLQLLVNGRDEIEVNDVIPVGDLFDVLVDDDVQTVTPELKKQFDTARRLYHVRLRPALLDIHQLTTEQADSLPPRHPLRTDERLVKTLLLSALAPDVPALSGLTASRLAALNHGTISAWLPGEEVAIAVGKLKQVGGHVSEVHVGEGDDPLITVELTDVDHESVLQRASGNDNEGNRRRALRELTWASLGVQQQNTLDGTQPQTLLWRGRRVTVDLVFGNVRDATELPESALIAVDDRWRVVVDYPFDSEGQSPRSDLARVEALRERGVESRTLFWLPAFLSRPRLEDLGTFVVLEHLLGGSGERFQSYADHLSPVDREQARSLLRQRRDLLRERLLDCLKQAYGSARQTEADIDVATATDTPFATLDRGFRPQPPVGASLRDAFRNLVDQAMTWSYPAHPRFEPGDQEVRLADLRRVLEYCERAVEAPAGRVTVDSRDRPVLRRLCGPLELGTFNESVFVLSDSTFPWTRRLLQAAARNGETELFPVRSLWTYLDEPQPRGLDRTLSALIVSVVALQQDLAWFRDGVNVAPPELDKVRPEHELRQPRLPEAGEWDAALRTARDALGLHKVGELRSAANLARLGDAARAFALEAVGGARDLERLLSQHRSRLGVGEDELPDRWRTAAAARTVVDALATESDDNEEIAHLAAAEWPTTATAALRSLEQAAAVAKALRDAQWEVVDALRAVDDHRRDAAESLLSELADTSRRDELSAPLAPTLRRVQVDGLKLITQGVRGPVDPGKGLVRGRVQVPAARLDDAVSQLREAVERYPQGAVVVSWEIRR